MDVLSDVFAAVRFSGGVFLDAEFTAPWCVVSQVGPDEFHAQGRMPAHLIAYLFSATLSNALLALGFNSISFSVGVIGFFVRTFSVPEAISCPVISSMIASDFFLKKCFTIRSSPE